MIDIHRCVKLAVFDFGEDWPEFDDPGKAALFVADDKGCVLHHTCPGCGRFGGIKISFNGTKLERPSWQLTSGDPKDPTTWTLAPSIWCKGCCGWHGYLTNGEFKSI